MREPFLASFRADVAVRRPGRGPHPGVLACAAAVAVYTALTGCSVTVRADGDSPSQEVQIPLDEATARIEISRAMGAADANATARITDDAGQIVEFTRQQRLQVSGVDLAGPDGVDEYAARVPIASSYTIRAVEPTVGVKDTPIDMPADFEIGSPASGAVVSLTGFRVEWTQPNTRLQVRIMLSQTVNGAMRTETLGPFSDTGAYDLSLSQLGGYGFVQAPTLTVTLTKVNAVTSVAGFKDGTATVELSATRTVTPGP